MTAANLCREAVVVIIGTQPYIICSKAVLYCYTALIGHRNKLAAAHLQAPERQIGYSFIVHQ